MYSRQNADSRTSRGIRIPSNYGGSAFSADSVQDTPAADNGVPPQNTDAIEANARSEPVEQNPETDKNADSVVPSGLSRLFGKGVSSGGIGFEELLILGLVFLISQNDTKDDLAFLLLLLLFIR